MAPVTFHGGPLHGITVDTDGPWPAEVHGAYQADGPSLVFVPDAELIEGTTEQTDVVHVRPSLPEAVETRPRTRKVTRR